MMCSVKPFGIAFLFCLLCSVYSCDKLDGGSDEDSGSSGTGGGGTYVRENLSENGSANCYIVSSAGEYRFKAVKGNSTESVGQIDSVCVLWETYGTDYAPRKKDLIAEVGIDDDYIIFRTPETFRKGNALIAVMDPEGTVLWSWHIWLTDKPEDQIYNNGAGIMMDRNLGAISASKGDVGALGLLYQWGRKDPFLNSSSISECVVAKSTLVWPGAVVSSRITGTIEYATANPTQFIGANENNYDWMYFPTMNTENFGWSSKKTIYDPCPVGYHVPDGGPYGMWAVALGTESLENNLTETADNTNKGFDLGGLSGTTYKLTDADVCWYPFSGCRDSNGRLAQVGEIGNYASWSRDMIIEPHSTNHVTNYYFSIWGNDGMCTSSKSFKAKGLSVRCVKE